MTQLTSDVAVISFRHQISTGHLMLYSRHPKRTVPSFSSSSLPTMSQLVLFVFRLPFAARSSMSHLAIRHYLLAMLPDEGRSGFQPLSA
jgi:hypothetical protein